MNAVETIKTKVAALLELANHEFASLETVIKISQEIRELLLHIEVLESAGFLGSKKNY